MSEVILTGILNVTPDSFSDGGEYLEVDAAKNQGEKLLKDGAKLIDIGADSTRPGSECVGPEEEWRRLESILPTVKVFAPYSIDTHHSIVAHAAVQHGASMINDVTAGGDPEMFSVVSDSDVRYVMMYSRFTTTHEFTPEPEGDIIDLIKDFFHKRIEKAVLAGVREEQIVLDPGMGRFISNSPDTSWEVIRRFSELTTFNLPLYFGSSRKGFLKLPGEKEVRERDNLSAFTGSLVAKEIGGAVPLYVRCHNVSLHRAFLEDLPPV